MFKWLDKLFGNGENKITGIDNLKRHYDITDTGRIRIKRNDASIDELYKHHQNSINVTADEVERVAESLTIGEVTENTNYSGIQELGNYISPVGNDKRHTVNIFEIRNQQKVLLASIQVTNILYSEWMIACCNSMWKTKFKVFHDCYGNVFPVGKLLQCTATLQY